MRLGDHRARSAPFRLPATTFTRPPVVDGACPPGHDTGLPHLPPHLSGRPRQRGPDPAAFGLGSGPEKTNVTDPDGNTAARSRLSSTDRSDTDLKRFSRHDRQMWAWITRIVSTGR
jgi:hypothetical protein